MCPATDRQLAETLFALFLVRSQRLERELFDKLCRAHPDLRGELELLYRSWSRFRQALEPHPVRKAEVEPGSRGG